MSIRRTRHARDVLSSPIARRVHSPHYEPSPNDLVGLHRATCDKEHFNSESAPRDMQFQDGPSGSKAWATIARLAVAVAIMASDGARPRD